MPDDGTTPAIATKSLPSVTGSQAIKTMSFRELRPFFRWWLGLYPTLVPFTLSVSPKIIPAPDNRRHPFKITTTVGRTIEWYDIPSNTSGKVMFDRTVASTMTFALRLRLAGRASQRFKHPANALISPLDLECIFARTLHGLLRDEKVEVIERAGEKEVDWNGSETTVTIQSQDGREVSELIIRFIPPFDQ